MGRFLDVFFKSAAEAVDSFSADHFAFAALVVLTFGFLSFFWFKNSAEWVRISISILLFLGGMLFALYLGALPFIFANVVDPNPQPTPTKTTPPPVEPSPTTNTDAENLFWDSIALLKQRAYEDAEKKLQNSVRIESGFADAYFLLGVSNLALGHCRDAVDNFTKAIQSQMTYEPGKDQLALTYIGSYAFRAKAYFLMRKYDQSEEDFRMAKDLVTNEGFIEDKSDYYTERRLFDEDSSPESSDFYDLSRKFGETRIYMPALEEVRCSR